MALPRVISQRGKSQLEIDRENFEKAQATSISKAVSSNEAPCKEKHVRTIIIGTFTDNGAAMVWNIANKLSLQGNAVVCWKFYNILHKVLRDGHPNCILDSLKYSTHLKDLGKLWGHLKEGYGRLIALYTKLIVQKLAFHKKYPTIPGNMLTSDEELEVITGRDVNSYFEMTVDLLDYMDEILTLQSGVFGSLDLSRSNSMTLSGQCRLAPLILCIQDSAPLYDYIVKLLFKLHSSLAADTLGGHRARFLQQYKSLTQFYYSSRNLQYFKHLIQIPSLPENPPNFLVASEIESHARPVVVIPNERPDTPETEVAGSLVDIGEPPPVPDRLDSVIPKEPFYDAEISEKNNLIEQLLGQIDHLRNELDRVKAEHVTVVQALHHQCTQLEKETEVLRRQLDYLDQENRKLKEIAEKQEDIDDVLHKLDETERIAKGGEEKFIKMKEMYGKLREEHVKLLRSNADVKRLLTSMEMDIQDKDHALKAMSGQLELALNEKKMVEEMMDKSSDNITTQLAEQTSAVMSLEESNKVLESRLSLMDKNKNNLEATLHETEEKLKEIENLKINIEFTLRETDDKCQDLSFSKETADKSLQKITLQLKESQDSKSVIEQQIKEMQVQIEELKAELSQTNEKWKISDDVKLHRSEKMCQNLLCRVVECAEEIVKESMEQIKSESIIAVKSSPGYLVGRLEPTVQSVEELHGICKLYLQDSEVLENLLKAITTMAYRLSDTIIQGKAASHQAPVDQGDDMALTCERCGLEGLEVFTLMKNGNMSSAIETIDTLLMSLKNALGQAELLLPKVQDVKTEEIGDMIEQEMEATTEAIEKASARFEEMLAKARVDHSGVQLEVNERIIDTCTSLMAAIRTLIEKSKALQREIVAQGRGGSSTIEFYKSHHRWTEGLLSAAKAVGWAATMLVDAADSLVSGNGKFEEVIVCSQEIVASTAQLVVSSRVKADPNSKCLLDLKEASKNVTSCTGNVVASAKSGAELIDEIDNMDFSNLSLTQAKRMEMNSQVKVLELESSLEKERRNLSDLRKKHYQLAGESEGWETEVNGKG